MTAGGGGELTTVFVNVVPTVANINDNFKSAGAQGAQAFSQGMSQAGGEFNWKEIAEFGVQAFKDAGGKIADVFKELGPVISGYIKTAMNITDDVIELGEKTASGFIQGLSKVMEGADFKDIMGLGDQMFGNFEKAGMDAFDNLAGKIPIVGSAITAMADTAVGGFDVMLGLTEQWLQLLADVGTTWQETERIIAAHTLDAGELERYMKIVQDIAASGVLVHFEDVAQAIALVNQRLPELASGIGGSDERLKEFVVTLAQADEILGEGYKINVQNLTAVMHSFGVAAEDENKVLIELTNTARTTGMDFNTLTAQLDRLGPQFTELGFSVQDAMYMLSEANKEGVKTTQFIYAFGQALDKLQTMVEKGRYPSLAVAFKDQLDAAKSELASADPAIQAAGAKLISGLFGRRFTPAEIKLIKDGLMDVQLVSDETGEHLELVKHHTEDLDKPFADIVEDTATIKDRLEAIGSQLKAAFMPLGLEFSKGLEEMGVKFSTWMREHGSEVVTWLTKVSHMALQFTGSVIGFVGQSLIALGPVAEFLKNVFATIGVMAAAMLKPMAMLSDALGITHGASKNVDDMIKAMKDLRAIDIQDPMVEFGKALKWAGETGIPELDDRITRMGNKAAETLKLKEALTKELPGRPEKPGGPEGPVEARSIFDINRLTGEIKLAYGMTDEIFNKEFKDKLEREGLKINVKDGIVQSIEETTPEAKLAFEEMFKEWFPDKTPDGKPAVKPKVVPQYSGPEFDPNQIFKNAPGWHMESDGPHVTPHIDTPTQGPLGPLGGPNLPNLSGTGGPLGPGGSGWRIPIPMIPGLPGLPPLGGIPIPGLPGPGDVKKWLKDHHFLPSSFQMTDDGNTTIPTSFELDPSKKGSKDAREIMTAMGVPDAMQSSDGVTLNVGFDMSHAASSFPGLPGPGSPRMPHRPGVQPAAFGGGGQAQVARYIYQAAVDRGYSPEDAVAIVAYGIGESALNPASSGGPQGGPGEENTVRGIFQEKPGFARGGGIDPALRATLEGNVYAYLNQLQQHAGEGDILDQLLATSQGGPMFTGGRGVMRGLIDQARRLLGMAAGGMPGLGATGMSIPGLPLRFAGGGAGESGHYGAGAQFTSLGMGFLEGIASGLGFQGTSAFEADKWKHFRDIMKGSSGARRKGAAFGGGGLQMCGGGHMYTNGGSADECPWCQIDKYSPKMMDAGEVPWLSRSQIGQDSIFAMLEPGEFIVRRKIAQQFLPELSMLNAGRVPGFGPGGGVGSGSADYAASGRSDDLEGVTADIYGADVIANQFGLTLTAGRSGHGTHDVDGGYHDKGEAGDFSNGMETPEETAFATYMAENFGGELAELIHAGGGWDPNYNINNGRFVGDMGGVPNVYDMGTLAGHHDHVHVAFKEGASPELEQLAYGGGGFDLGASDASFDMGGGGFGGGFGASPAGFGVSPAGFGSATFGGGGGGGGAGVQPVDVTTYPQPPGVPGGPSSAGNYPPGSPTPVGPFTPGQPVPGVGPGPAAGGPGQPPYSPYGPFPPIPIDQDTYDKWKRSWDQRTYDDMINNQKGPELDQQINDAKQKLADDTAENTRLHATWDKLTQAQKDAERAQDSELYRDITRSDKAIKDDKQALQSLENQGIRNRLRDQDKEPYPLPSGLSFKGEKIKPDEHAKELGMGLVKGIFEGLGFTADVFGKPFTEWGIWKTMMAGMNWGVGLLQNMGRYPTGLFGPGGPLAGRSWGTPQEQAAALASGGPWGLGGHGGGAIPAVFGGLLPDAAHAGSGALPGPARVIPKYTGPPVPHDGGGQGPPTTPSELIPHDTKVYTTGYTTMIDQRGSINAGIRDGINAVRGISHDTQYAGSGPIRYL